ncbi:hypothetical protein Tco_0290121 [Tanacetum coccineum]
MALSIADQIALDDALVAPADRLKIGKCNLLLSSDITSKEATLQVVYIVLKLTPFYKAFQVTADALEIYMQEFWASAYVHNRSVRFKMNNKKHIIGLEQFRDDIQRQLYKALVEAYEADKILLDTYGDTITIKRPRDDADELTDSTFDFSAFVLNRLNVQTLTPELLAGPTFELMKGTCKSLTELEYFCEEVYKATTEKLDWINPEGRQYPHDLRQPLPLVPNSQGRRVIPFHHFINNDLEYLRGGVSSRKYSTSVTKTTAADYRHIKWIEDLVPNSMWSQTIVK